MTFDEFKADFRVFLENSTVNLGRKTAKTRQEFIVVAMYKFDAFDKQAEDDQVSEVYPKKPTPMSGSVMCIKPRDKNKGLDVGKGVHSMTPSESMRADEQLNRSPFGDRKGQDKG